MHQIHAHRTDSDTHTHIHTYIHTYIQELSETFEVSISGVINASMSSESQIAVVTIVGVNDTPVPRYINDMLV